MICIFTRSLKSYSAGNTPNPDIWCNRYIKFELFYQQAKKLGADFIATGHYARKNTDHPNNLYISKDSSKDQTYFLYAIKKQVLPEVLFPLGDLIKSEVRQIATDLGLAVANKKDSTGICFIGERNMADFLSSYLDCEEGDFVDTEGNLLGKHKGAILYTLGQRNGLGVGGVKNGKEDAWFVVKKHIDKNQVVLAQGHNNPLLFSNRAVGDQQNWLIDDQKLADLFNVDILVRLRHRGELVKCKIKPQGQDILIEFYESQRAISTGQSAVFYYQDICLGGVIVKNIYTADDL